jgi:hypothetical protein
VRGGERSCQRQQQRVQPRHVLSCAL